MPNLVGVHDPSATPEVLGRDLARMMRAVDLPAFPFVRRTVAGDAIACGNVLTGVEPNTHQPARDPERGLWLMLDGEVVNARELARELARRGLERFTEDDSTIALGAFVLHGRAAFDRLNGQWNLVLHDPAQRTTWLVSDRHGSRILFFAEDGPRFVFASEVKGVIAGRSVPTRAGGIGLVQLLSAGAHVGDRTWLEGIRAFPPGTSLELTPERRRRTRYHRLRFREAGPEASEDAYAEGFARKLRAATERCMRHVDGHPVAITLSGGLDSRSVALSVERHHLPMKAITYGAADSPDVVYARQLAEVIGMEHVYIEGLWPELVDRSGATMAELAGPSPSGRRSFYSAQLDRVVWRSEGMAALNGVASTIWHPLYRELMRVMLNGACGDAMTGSHLTPNLLLRPSRSELIRDLERRTLSQDPELVRLVLDPSQHALLGPELSAYFASTFDDIDASEPLALSNVWDMENRQRRGTFSSFTIERYFCTCRSPYLDYDLIEHLASVPGLWRFQQRIYKRMLVTHFPEAAHVPWAYTRGRITKSPGFEFAREVFNFGKGRLARVLPRRAHAPAHWLFRDEVTLMREDRDLAVELERFAGAGWFPDGVLDRRGVLEVSRRFARGERPEELSLLYAHLVGLARCCELFLSGGTIELPATADPARFGVATGA